ncbi:MAG: DNA topoisomerase VI, partial [Planctomycetes bacterium]|nr:DNA topoisomerase VI [Planctomycetota bacterium]
MAKKQVTKKKKTTPKVTRPARQAAPRKRRKSGNGDAGASLEQLADQIVAQAAKGTGPALEIPIRSLGNVKFNVKSRLIEMGSNTQQRSLFNYGQAKRFMQTMLVASKCKELIDAGKSASIRQIYYMSKHTIKGTTEKTFDDQTESDPVLEDLE